jgi:hypothetical protein
MFKMCSRRWPFKISGKYNTMYANRPKECLGALGVTTTHDSAEVIGPLKRSNINGRIPVFKGWLCPSDTCYIYQCIDDKSHCHRTFTQEVPA